MDFFEHQDRARRNTGRLVALFIAAVLGIIASTYALVMALLYWAQGDGGGASFVPYEGVRETAAFALLQPDVLALVALGTSGVVGFGSMYKIAQLAGGGHVVAEHLGGRRLYGDSTDPLERKVLNVVEEMAIASGTAVPPVYLLDRESGINAFAAGFSPDDAVIGITRGCAEQLTRDQLQGVVAHEFSHILNGDMRLNIRLIGIIHGILIIGLIGYYLFRVALYSNPHRSSSSNGKSNPLPLIALGVGLAVIGFIGTLFGNLIKAAVSRQREFLADASAVQFTRNPDGIAGALRVIGGFDQGSAVRSPNAPEASHMFFAMGIASGLQSMFATHPPLDERIRRIDRHWDMQKAERAGESRASGGGIAAAGVAGFAGETAPTAIAQPPRESAVASIGRPSEQHVEYARRLVGSIPGELVEAAHEPYRAQAVVFALLLDADEDTRRSQLERLAVKSDSGIYHATAKLLAVARELDAKARLPLIEMTLPALRAMSARQYARFRANVAELVKADRRVELFEWVLQKVVIRRLDVAFGVAKPARVSMHRVSDAADEAAVLLSALAYVGARDPDAATRAFAAGAEALGVGVRQKPMSECKLGSIDAALTKLATLTPQPKGAIIRAAAATIAADRTITTGEAELLRAVCESLDCPMPPLLPGQAVA